MQSELPASRPVKEALSEADVILLSYYFSDVTAEKDESKNAKFVERLAAMMSDSCMFVVIDANYVKPMVSSVFSGLLETKSVKNLISSIANNEQTSTLTDLLIKAGIEHPMTPQIEAKAFALVAEKTSDTS